MTTPTILSASQLKESFHKTLSEAAEAYQKAEAAFATLRSLADAHDCGTLPYRTRITVCAAHAWMDEQLVSINNCCSGIGRARLDSNSISFTCALQEDEGDRDFRCGDMPWRDYIEALVDANDFDDIERQLREQAEGLEDKGLQQAANRIAQTLNLKRHRYHSDPGPTRQKRKVLFTADIRHSYGSYDYSCIADMRELAEALRVAEAETGMAGVANGAAAVARALDNCTWNNPLPSRTRIGDHTAAPSVAYRACVKFELSPQDADSLIAFLRLYASVPLWDSEREAA